MPGLLLASLVALLGPPVQSQTTRWEGYFDPVGYSFPAAFTAHYLRKSFHLQGAALYQLHEWFAGGAELGYATGHSLGGKLGEVDFDSPADGRPDSLQFTSSAKLFWVHFTPMLRIGRWIEFDDIDYRPYIMMGAGMYHLWHRAGVTKINGISTRGAHFSEVVIAQRTDADTDIGASIGVGIEQRVLQRWRVAFDLRLHHVWNAADFDRDGRDDDSLNWVIPSLRLGYAF